MALATKCPHCNTIFRVAHDQLKLRGGIVRCGACNEVFDGNAALVVPNDLPAGPLLAPAPAPALQPQSLPVPAPLEDQLAALDTRAATELQGEHEEPIYTLELDSIESEGEPVAEAAASQVDASDAAETVEATAAAASEVAEVVQSEPAAFEPAAFEPAALHDNEAHAAPPTETDEEAVDFDLDLNGDDEPQTANAAEPPATAYASADADADADAATAATAGESPAELLPEVPPTPPEPELELELDVESMSDEELEAALAAELEAIAATEAEPAAIDAVAFEDAHTVDDAHTIDLDTTIPDGVLPPPDDRREPTFGEPPSEHLVAAAITDGHHGHEDDLLDEDEEALVQLSSSALARAGRDAHAGASAAAAADAGDLALADDEQAPADSPDRLAEDHDDAASFDEPGFVKRDRRNQKLRKTATIAMSIGSVLLVAALFGQVIATFRNPLAAYVPALKQPLSQICALLGCKIELPAQIDYVTIEQGELQTLTETTFSFTTLLRNQSTTAQAWPHIELILDDASDKAILRRVFAPRDYLPAGADLAQGFAPHTEQSVKLYFELGQLKASGYHIAVFYP